MKLNLEKKSQDKKSKIDIIKNLKIMIPVLIVFIFLGGFLFYTQSLKPVQDKKEAYLLEVEEGAYFDEVLDTLAQDNLIKQKLSAKIYAKLSGKQNVASGVYDLDKSWDTKTIINYINDTIPHKDISVKFEEASWAKNIAKILSENFDLKKEDILATWNDEAYIESLIERYDFLTKDILKNKKDKNVLLEGFLYPDTYAFDVDSSIEDITEIMLDNFDEKFSTLQDEIKESEFTTYELMTLSSMVMYEAGDGEDQVKVAGVFMNRLEEDMMLQSSVTVCYALYEYDTWVDCEFNTNIDSPYNTYQHTGLPISPILNPNIEAIKNTLNYTKHDYFFFVADVYEGGDGTVYYSKTFKEHEQKISELQNR